MHLLLLFCCTLLACVDQLARAVERVIYELILAAIFFSACRASSAASTLPTLLQNSAANNRWSIELDSADFEATETEAEADFPFLGGRPRFFGSPVAFLRAWLTSATETL